MKYRKKTVIVEATRWFKNGDHPMDNTMRPFEDTGQVPTEPREGEVVRYFRHPNVGGQKICKYCNQKMHHHGWIDTPDYGRTVCVGDWVITGLNNEYYPCKPDVFEKSYEMVNIS